MARYCAAVSSRRSDVRGRAWMYGAERTSKGSRLQAPVLAVIALGIAGCSDGSGSAAGQIRPTAATFSGSGGAATPSFTVASGWEIRWTAEGKQFQVAATGAQNLGVLVNSSQPGGGSTFPRGKGKFRLQI